MINARLIWYYEKHRILDRSQCGFRKHRSTTDHMVSLERYLRDAFAQRQQAVGLFFDLEKAYETNWQYGIIRDLHRIGLRGRLPVLVSGYFRDLRIRVRIGTTLSDEFYPEEGVPTGGVLGVTCFGLKIKELTWNGEGTETHSWCFTVPLFVPSLTMDTLCMARHQPPM